MEKHNGKKAPELGRRKCHWDYVLEEMKWMAKDFYEVCTLGGSVAQLERTSAWVCKVVSFGLECRRSMTLIVILELFLAASTVGSVCAVWGCGSVVEVS